MRTLIHEDAAALTVPCRPPGAGIIICLRPVPVADYPHRALHLSQRALLHEFTHLREKLICPLVEHDPEDTARLLRGPVQSFGGSCIDSLRFFREHMFSRFQRFLRDDRMKRMRNSNNDRIDLFVRENFPIVHFRLNAAKTLPCGFTFPAVCVTNRSQLHAFDITPENMFRMSRSHIAVSDDGCSYFIHLYSPYPMTAALTLSIYIPRIPHAALFAASAHSIHYTRS